MSKIEADDDGWCEGFSDACQADKYRGLLTRALETGQALLDANNKAWLSEGYAAPDESDPFGDALDDVRKALGIKDPAARQDPLLVTVDGSDVLWKKVDPK